MVDQIGETYAFANETYTLLESHILPDDERMPFLYKMNGVAILFIVIAIAVSLPLFWGRIIQDYNWWLIALLFISFLPYVVIHEFLHAISFVLFSKQPWSTIEYGLILKNGVAYCLSSVPVTVRRARLSLMMPVYVVCIPVFVFGFYYDYYPLILFGIFLISGSVGDFYYLWKLKSYKGSLYMYEKPPTKQGYEIGFLLFEKN